MKIGRICVKIAGRDAGKKCVILSVDKGYALIDGETRRKKINLLHLEPTEKVIEISENAPTTEVIDVFKKELNILIKEKKPKENKIERPRRNRKIKKEVKNEGNKVSKDTK